MSAVAMLHQNGKLFGCEDSTAAITSTGELTANAQYSKLKKVLLGYSEEADQYFYMLVGRCGLSRFGQLVLHYNYPSMLIVEEEDFFLYLLKSVIPGIQQELRDGGINIEGEDNYKMPGSILFGIPSIGGRDARIIKIGRTFDLVEDSQTNFNAIGAGGREVNASLKTIRYFCGTKFGAELRLKFAFEVAQKYNTYVNEPFYIQEINSV